jgi:hypothetical protein
MAFNSPAPNKVYIVRHVIVNAGHFQEYFAPRSTAVPEVHHLGGSVLCMDILNCERVTTATVPINALDVSLTVTTAYALPAPQLGRGSDHEETAVAETEANNEPVDATVVIEENDAPFGGLAVGCGRWLCSVLGSAWLLNRRVRRENMCCIYCTSFEVQGL